ncbi:MAG: 2,3-bisphosphoglycerate-independent phosphoglycerate mutase [Pseudomonadota bacterium]
MSPRPIALIILDGFGHKETDQYNAINQANTPNLDHYFANYAHTFISGSGHDVGLPDGQMGNSEVGHLNIGCGRMVPQDLTRIDDDIAHKTFYQNTVLSNALQNAKKTGNNIHILGLLSDGGVHSHINHILAMINCAHQQGLDQQLFLHAFLDGRDTPPQSALPFLQQIENQGYAKIASITGRYYAMDRDNRWERVQAAYDMLTLGKAEYNAENAEVGLMAAYARNENDEFVKPTIIKNNFKPIQDGDIVIFMNFRSDRARQLTLALMDPHFNHFVREKKLALQYFISLTEYKKEFNDFQVEVAYPPIDLSNSLGEVLSRLGKKQLRIAETEKYPHVTFFFNGGIETPFEGEDRILVPSPKVATYDLKPEMSAYELTEKLVEAIQSQKYDVIICNYANPDMVGHTGNIPATIKAIEVIDECVGKVVSALQSVGGEAIITADHGNAECMYDETTHQPHTAHTCELVPFLYIGRKAKILKQEGVLADIAPTLLALMGLTPPKEMTGTILVKT